MNYFDSDMSKSTNTVLYIDWKTINGSFVYKAKEGRHLRIGIIYILGILLSIMPQ